LPRKQRKSTPVALTELERWATESYKEEGKALNREATRLAQNRTGKRPEPDERSAELKTVLKQN